MLKIGESTPSFREPLALLRACHQRILRHCDTLERIPAHLASVGVDAQAVEAATRILRYFDEAGPAHHADEEQQLFPWLRSQPACAKDVQEVLHELSKEHRQLEKAWHDLATDLRQLVATRRYSNLRWEPFVSLNRRHVQIENDDIYPLAERLLDPQTAAELGAAMAARRSIRG
ncbi:hemerythrin domain-containing protein [Acidithiobacillus sp. AC3]